MNKWVLAGIIATTVGALGGVSYYLLKDKDGWIQA